MSLTSGSFEAATNFINFFIDGVRVEAMVILIEWSNARFKPIH